MKKLIWVIIIILVVFLGWFGYDNFFRPKEIVKNSDTENKEVKIVITDNIKKVLNQKLKLLEDLASDRAIVENVQSQNLKNASLTNGQIQELDQKWKSFSAVESYFKPYLTNKTALKLIEFQEKNPGFVEIFVTDKYGLNVGQTNITSDFLQSDEEWWIKAFAGGMGLSYFGELEYDESAASESISLYVPILDNDKKAVGIIKAVMNITAIQREL